MELRPTWIAVAIVTCVIFGSTLNRCLTWGKPLDQQPAPPVVVEEGTPFVEEKGAPGEGGEPPAVETKPAPVVAEPAPEVVRPPGLEEHEDLTFQRLGGYPYEVHEWAEGMTLNAQIPAPILKFQGRKVAIKGFMLPYRNDGENVTEFILLQNQGLCCFGRVPRMNEWVFVRMAPGKAAPYALDIPITVFGTLAVGEVYEKNVLMSLYRMESTAVIVPPVYR